MKKKLSSVLLCVICIAAFSAKLQAQESAEELAKKLANPIASLISVPFQNNSDYGICDLNGSNSTADSIFSSSCDV
jgi:hypothetical protein